MVTSRCLKHVGNELGGDWCSRFVFLVLPGVRETRNDSRDAPCGSSATCVNHDKQLHKVVINAVGARLNNEHIFIAHRLAYY